ncbi:MAG: hypothetical protein L3J71_11090 [Victivallaceae bacterium]|nr:hypothetical protein [Victivallaceae bacterium]
MNGKKIILLFAVMITGGLLVNAAHKASWPRSILVADTMLIVYQPKLDAFSDSELKARVAVEIQLDGVEKSLFCSVWFKAACSVNKAERKVYLEGITIEKIVLPGVSDQIKQKIGDIIKANFLKNSSAISLDYLLAMLAETTRKKQIATSLNNQPPKILFSTIPMVLVRVDGSPKQSPVSSSNLTRVINSDALIVFDPSGKKYYLQFGNSWFSSTEIAGVWNLELSVPTAIKQLGVTAEATEKKEPAFTGKVYVATEPTALLQVNDKAELALIPQTDLLYVKNSEDDLFLDSKTQQIYVLIAGRWFTAKSKEGPWSYISSKQLPKGFRDIPPDSEKASVLSSITGTSEAKAAVLENDIPQTTKIKRGSVKLNVEYDGKPQFAAIKGTEMAYAVNTDFSVLKIDNKYYCCHNAVWFTADSANGPWQVATAIPAAIKLLPPTCPLFNVKFVKIYEYDKSIDEVTIGYTAGYNDSFVVAGCIVYGTGYNYRPWIGKKYYSRPLTYGISAKYDPVSGGWNHLLMADAPPEVTLYGKTRVSLNSKLPQVIRERQQAREAKARQQRAGRELYVADDGSVYRKSLDGWEKVSNDTPGESTAKSDNSAVYAKLNRQLLVVKRAAVIRNTVTTRVNSRGYRNYDNNRRTRNYRSYRPSNTRNRRYRSYYRQKSMDNIIP